MVWKIVKRIFYVLLAVFAVYVVIMIFRGTSESKSAEVLPTPGAVAAYLSGEEFLTHGTCQSVSYEGRVKEYSILNIPSEKEIQVTLKINKSFFSLVGAEENSPLYFKLFNTETEEEIPADDYSGAEDSRYMYYRISFTGVEFSGKADLEVVISSEDFATDYSVIKIHAANQEFEKYELSKEEMMKLEENKVEK